MSEPNQPYWLSWIVPMLAVFGVLGAHRDLGGGSCGQ